MGKAKYWSGVWAMASGSMGGSVVQEGLSGGLEVMYKSSHMLAFYLRQVIDSLFFYFWCLARVQAYFGSLIRVIRCVLYGLRAHSVYSLPILAL